MTVNAVFYVINIIKDSTCEYWKRMKKKQGM